MRCVFVQSSIFTQDWKALKRSDEDLQELEALIMDRGGSAPAIRGTGGARKIRFSPSSRAAGKSGGYRVIYGWFERAAQAHLFLVYGKNQQAELTADERKLCKQLMERIEAVLRK